MPSEVKSAIGDTVSFLFTKMEGRLKKMIPMLWIKSFKLLNSMLIRDTKAANQSVKTCAKWRVHSTEER